MSNKLPIRMMTDELYDKLKKDGSFTEVNSFTGESETVQDIPQALNCVVDTTEQDIANIQQEVTKVKDQVATFGSKVYLHELNLIRANETDTTLRFPVYSTKETRLTSLSEVLTYIHYQTGYIMGSHIGICAIMAGGSGLRVVGSGFGYYDFDWNVDPYYSITEI